jgi:hypothetical protein
MNNMKPICSSWWRKPSKLRGQNGEQDAENPSSGWHRQQVEEEQHEIQVDHRVGQNPDRDTPIRIVAHPQVRCTTASTPTPRQAMRKFMAGPADGDEEIRLPHRPLAVDSMERHGGRRVRERHPEKCADQRQDDHARRVRLHERQRVDRQPPLAGRRVVPELERHPGVAELVDRHGHDDDEEPCTTTCAMSMSPKVPQPRGWCSAWICTSRARERWV